MEQEFICEFCRQRSGEEHLGEIAGLSACYQCGPYIIALDYSAPRLASHLRARAICNTMARHGWRQV